MINDTIVNIGERFVASVYFGCRRWWCVVVVLWSCFHYMGAALDTHSAVFAVLSNVIMPN